VIAQERLDRVIKFGTPKAIPAEGYYVYVITENNSICYIGKGRNQRVKSHFNNSSNQLLASRMRENKDFFDWFILDTFDNEYDCFNYEELLIRNCKELNHKLYNKIHYSNTYQYNAFFRGMLSIFKQWEEMIFEDNSTSKILSPTQSADIIFSMIKDFCKGLTQVPSYRGKPMNELGYKSSIEQGKIRITVI
jgi:hypothetical protein